jgi:hypothetical protein
MTQFNRKFFGLLVLDAITIVASAVLLLRGFWQPATAIVAALFIANVFLVPSALRVKSESQVSDKRQSKLWFWGFALLAAAFVRLAFFMQSGFSWPGVAGVVAGVLLGTLFLFIAKKSKEVTH